MNVPLTHQPIDFMDVSYTSYGLDSMKIICECAISSEHFAMKTICDYIYLNPNLCWVWCSVCPWLGSLIYPSFSIIFPQKVSFFVNPLRIIFKIFAIFPAKSRHIWNFINVNGGIGKNNEAKYYFANKRAFSKRMILSVIPFIFHYIYVYAFAWDGNIIYSSQTNGILHKNFIIFSSKWAEFVPYSVRHLLLNGDKDAMQRII